jgi:hypothetical protein
MNGLFELEEKENNEEYTYVALGISKELKSNIAKPFSRIIKQAI